MRRRGATTPPAPETGNMEPAAESIEKVGEAALRAAQGIDALDQAIDRAGESSQQLSRAEEALRRVGRQARQAGLEAQRFSDSVARSGRGIGQWSQALDFASMLMGRGGYRAQSMVMQIRRLGTATKGAAAGLTAASAGIGVALAAVARVASVVADRVSKIVDRTKRLTEAYLDAAGYTKALNDAQDQLSAVLATGSGYLNVRIWLMQKETELMAWSARKAAEFIAWNQAMAEAYMDWNQSLGLTTRALLQLHPALNLGATYLLAYRTHGERAARQQEILNEMMGRSQEFIRTASGEMEKLIQAYERFADEAGRQVIEHFQVQGEHQKEMLEAAAEHGQRLSDIARESDEHIAVINEQAADRRLQTYQDYYARIEELQTRAYREEEEAIRRHQMDTQHDSERHHLSMLQDERRYWWQRQQLVAEGDVLAIEELDARYQLERQAAEENFQLQQRQAEESFQMQLQLQRQSIAIQLADLREGLAQQLREIEEQRQTQIAEEQKQAERRRTEENERYRQQEQQMQATHQRQLQQEAQHWVQMATQADVGLSTLLRLITSYYGPGSSMDGAIRQAWQRWAVQAQIYENIARAALSLPLQPIPTGAGARPIRSTRQGRGLWAAYQYGGEFIADRPTPIIVGERGVERVTIQPIPASLLAVSWRGGPIPVVGRGQMTGLDLQAVGDEIARGLIIALERALM